MSDAQRPASPQACWEADITETRTRPLHTLLGSYRHPVVWVLGITQTIAYGTLYYAFGVAAPVISRDFNIGLDAFFLIFSIGLLASAVIVPHVGRWMDTRGARTVMAVGSTLCAITLAMASQAPHVAVFAVAIIAMQMAGCFCFYEASFTALTQIFRDQSRQPITAITLIAGFASTIFWPLTQLLLEMMDWRTLFLIYAAGNLGVCASLHWLALRAARPLEARTDARDRPSSDGLPATDSVDTSLPGRHVFWLYTAAISTSGLVYSSFSQHMLRIIEHEGFTAQSAAAIAMIMGPAQVVARLVEISFGQRFDALTTGRIALGSLAGSILILLASSGTVVSAILFAALFGISNGLITITRGTVPLQLFGIAGYGGLVSRVTRHRYVAAAIGPVLFAAISIRLGTGAAVLISGLIASLAVGLFLLLRRPSKS